MGLGVIRPPYLKHDPLGPWEYTTHTKRHQNPPIYLCTEQQLHHIVPIHFNGPVNVPLPMGGSEPPIPLGPILQQHPDCQMNACIVVKVLLITAPWCINPIMHRPVKIEWWGVGVVICLDGGADCLHMVQQIPLHPKTVSSLASLKDWFHFSGAGLWVAR